MDEEIIQKWLSREEERERTAIEPVVIMMPPSVLESKVGFAALRRACGALTLADQHCECW